MRAALGLKWDRSVKGKFISPGSYTIVLKDGKRKQFDFLLSESGVDSDDESRWEAILSDLDTSYEDGSSLTIDDIINIDHIEEIYIGVNEDMDAKVVSLDYFDFEDNADDRMFAVVSLPEEILDVKCVYVEAV